MRQRHNVHKQGFLIWARPHLTLEGGVWQLGTHTCPPHRNAFGCKETHQITLLGDGPGFCEQLCKGVDCQIAFSQQPLEPGMLLLSLLRG
ncbi:MAG: hypothetical protein MI924_04950 [Chloroflexales bacterium]|nr:hypothetical protein [Chloroflexales bacterium]